MPPERSDPPDPARDASEEWTRYARAVIVSMREVLDDAHHEHHGIVLETADYWLSLGLAIGLQRPVDADRLLALILAEEHEQRAELDADVHAFCAAALA